MKKCSKCGIEKPETSEYFPKHPRGKNGLNACCKVCRAEYTKLYRESNKETHAARCKIWHKNNVDREKIYRKAYMEAHKEESKRNHRLYYEANKESEMAYAKQWRLSNPEYRGQYREANIEAEKAYGKQWAKDNPDKKTRQCKKWRAKNLEYFSQWRKNNPDKIVAKQQRRRARQKSLPATLTADQWQLAKNAFDNKCCYCGKEAKLHQEHFIALSKGGEYTINNIVPSCQRCNFSKHAKDFFKWYPKQEFYSKVHERGILKYLNYKNEIQQFSLAF